MKKWIVLPVLFLSFLFAEEKFYVVLTFDDGPYPGYTEEILEILKRHKIKATFFVTGMWVEKHLELVKMIDENGHQIGLHGYRHIDYTKLSKKQVVDDLLKTKYIVEGIIGKNKIKYFRPPAGKINKIVKNSCAELGLKIVLWTIYPLDYGEKEAEKILYRIKKAKYKKYNVLLLHNGIKNTILVLDRIISEIKNLGGKFVSLEELPNDFFKKSKIE